MCPGIDVSDLDCGLYTASDGVANPSDITMSLAKGARNRGVKIIEGTGVLGFEIENGSVVGVKTTRGDIKCDKVLAAAGTWSRELGRMAGVNIPVQPSHHQYMVTEKLEGISPTMPSRRCNRLPPSTLHRQKAVQDRRRTKRHDRSALG